jgi:hypothetical protein
MRDWADQPTTRREMEEGQKTVRGTVFPTTVDHDRQIQPTLMGLDVGDIRHPDPVGCSYLELSVEGIGRDHSRLAAISSRAPLVADLGRYACQASQPGDPVLGNLFPEIAQIVGELAIAIDLAAVGPSLPDQLGLPRIVPHARRLNGSLSQA